MAMAAILEIKGLSKHFGGLRAIQNLDMEVHQGEIFGIIGPNGSGKTTLLNVITGFLSVTAGSIIYKGALINGLKPHQIAKKGIMRTFQLTTLFPDLTAVENIMNGRYLKTSSSILGSIFNTRSYRKERMKLRERADEILAFMKMQEGRDMLARNMPSAMQRKLEIAIALAGDPDLLLVDEPVAGMNPEEALEMMRLIQAIRDMGMSVVVVEHNMKVIMGLCTRIAALNYGEKIAEGAPEEIANDDAVISAYLGRGRRHAQG